MRRRCLLGLLPGLLLAACTSDPVAPPDVPPAPQPATPPPAADTVRTGDSLLVGDPPTWVPGPLHAPPADWTAGIVDVERSATPMAVLREVRTGTHEGFVRTVFAFDTHVPGYHVEYVDRPVRRCGSGEAVAVAGDGWLEVRFRTAAAHTEAGVVTVAERDRRLDGPLLRQLLLTCDFEGDVTWVLGLAAPNRYRIAELADPPRLVLDVRR